jgi:hypothetical protein
MSTEVEDSEEYVFDFGQHIGKKISDVPSAYLQWIVLKLEDVKGSTKSVKECVDAATEELYERGEDYD